MFDYIKCHYPLPFEGANDLVYQTKDTPSQFMDNYEIREDGSLWYEYYELEDRSAVGLWLKKNPDKTYDDAPKYLKKGGFPRVFLGKLSKRNKKWVKVDNFIGEIRFYSSVKDKNEPAKDKWTEWSAYFEQGKLVRLNQIV